MDILTTLKESFSNYLFIEDNHSYSHPKQNNKLTSVTTFLSKLKKPFNTEFWSVLKGFEVSGYTITSKNEKKNYFLIDKKIKIIPGEIDYSLFNLSKTPEDIKSDWDFIKHLGLSRGSYLHKLLEDIELGNEETNHHDFIDDKIQKGIEKKNNNFDDMYDIYSSIEWSYSALRNLAYQFIEENKNYLDPIAIEFMVGDLDLGIAGTFDRLYFNKKSNQYEIWDFKTDKKLDLQNKYQKLDLFDLDDCEFEKYSLQTSLYKYIIEKNTPIKLGTSHIVHFKFRDNSYDIVPCNDYTELIKEKLDNGNNWSTYFKR